MSSYAERSAQAYSAAGYSYTSMRSPSQTPSPSAYATTRQSSQNYLSNYESTSSFVSATEEREQTRLLSESMRHVQEQALLIRQAVDMDDLPTVLEKAMSLLYILGDSRTHRHYLVTPQEGGESPVHGGRQSSTLTAKNYYEIHMRVCEELVILEDYFLTLETSRKGYSLVDLYEMVQYCPRVVPRAYLRICCAAATLRTRKEIMNSNAANIGSVPFILQELMDTVKCVQCPIPGLFVRYYLLQALKDVLPDEASDVSIPADRKDNSLVFREDENVVVETTQCHHELTNASVSVSYEFLINNFVEMNKLWVRIQHLPDDNLPLNQTHSILHRGNTITDAKQAKKKRERERNELRILVGTNIDRLSHLDGVTSTVYGTVVLPKLLEQIVNCRDPLAQAYLMDCIIQVFPDEYHIQTLEVFLGVCPKLREKVNTRTIIQSMMDRLANYFLNVLSTNSEDDGNRLKTSLILDSIQMFSSCIRSVIEARSNSMPLKDIVRLEATLLKYSLRCVPENFDLIAKCLENCNNGLKNRATMMSVATTDDQDLTSDFKMTLDDQAVTELEFFLTLSLDRNSFKILYNCDFHELFSILPWSNQTNVSRSIIKQIINSETKIEDVNDLQKVLTLTSPLLQDKPEADDRTTVGLINALAIHDIQGANSMQPPRQQQMNGTINSEDMVMIVQLIHSLETADTDTWFDLIRTMANCIATCNSLRQRFAIPAIVYGALKLIENIQLVEYPQKTVHVINEAITSNSSVTGGNLDHENITVPNETIGYQRYELDKPHESVSHIFERTIRCSQLADKTSGSTRDFPVICYEFMTHALKVYDECSVDHSARKITYLHTLIGTLLECRCFDVHDYDNLSTRLAQYAARLLRKADQCKLLLKCAHLFYNCGMKDEKLRNPQRSLECLQRALKIADSCISVDLSNIYLLVDVLDAYLFFYESKSPAITAKYIMGLIALIKEHVGKSGTISSECMENFNKVIDYIQRRKAAPSTAELFATIDV